MASALAAFSGSLPSAAAAAAAAALSGCSRKELRLYALATSLLVAYVVRPSSS